MRAILVKVLIVAAAVLILPQMAGATLETPYEIVWIRQVGTVSTDVCGGVSADGLGNVFVSGQTIGQVAFVSKYDMLGALLWTRPMDRGRSRSVSGDGLGNVYVSGTTTRSISGDDTYVSKFDTDGNLLWNRQLGTPSTDICWGSSADALGNVYVAGGTRGALGAVNYGGEDAYLGKYDPDGNLMWIRQLGTSANDKGLGVSTDASGNVYLSGQTSGSLAGDNTGSIDAFLGKFDSAGALMWIDQFGTDGQDAGLGVSVDDIGNVYIVGLMEEGDAFVSKYEDTGDPLWTRQLGTSSLDQAYDVSADGFGNVYIAGRTDGSLGGPNAGGRDAFVSKYNDAGDLLWTKQFGTEEWDFNLGISADEIGNVFVSGYTNGSLGGPNAGVIDGFLANLVVPEPGTLLLLGLGGLSLIRRRRG